MPHFVEGMWMRRSDGRCLAGCLYGPSRVETDVSVVRVSIEEETSYPVSDEVCFVFEPDGEFEFFGGLDHSLTWSDPGVVLQGEMVDADGRPVKAGLVPQGSTILRRVGFPRA